MTHRLTLMLLLTLAAGRAHAQISDARRAAAQRAFDAVLALHSSMDTARVKAALAAFAADYPEAEHSAVYTKLQKELDVIGRDAGELAPARWFQGDVGFDHGDVTALVFFETWCPHCRDEMPKLKELAETFEPRGVSLVLVTKASKPATFTDVIAFITEWGLTMPVARDDGSLSDHFGVAGVPAAVLVKEGKVIWRGNAARLEAETLEKALAFPSPPNP